MKRWLALARLDDKVRHRLRGIGLTFALLTLAWIGTTTPAIANCGASDPEPTSPLSPSIATVPGTLTTVGDFAATQYVPVVAQTIADIETSTLYRYVGDLSGEWPVEIAGMPYTLTTRYSYADEAIAMAES